MPSKVLIFAYYSFKDPVFQSAVLPYFTELKFENCQFVLLTFEHNLYQYYPGEEADIENYLKKHSIVWYRLKWHSGKFKLFKKAYDLASSLLFVFMLIKKHNIQYIYSEGFPGAILGLFISKGARIPHIIHSFEPHGAYMVESGVWSLSSWEYKVQTYFEKKVAMNAHKILTATDLMAKKIRDWGTSAKIYKAPSCVDTNHFNLNNEDRELFRERLGVCQQEILFVYLGKFGGMYMDEQFFILLNKIQAYEAFDSKFLIISKDDPAYLEEQIERHQIKKGLINVLALTREEVPKYLNAGDFGIVAVKSFPSKRFCSPIKNGEFWACGLPIIIPEGVSDDFLVVEKEGIGIIWRSEESVPKKVHEFIQSEAYTNVRSRCFHFVNKERSLQSVKGIYNKLFL